MRLAIDDGGYLSATEAASEANSGLASAFGAFTSTVRGQGSMAGSDDCGAGFAEQYDPAAAAALQAYADLVNACGAISQLSHTSALNYRNANRASTLRGPGQGNDEPAPVITTVPTISAPSALGGDGAGPGWWHWIADKLGGLLYPDADTDRLRAAGARWQAEAENLEKYTSYLLVAGNELGHQGSAEAALARATCQDVQQHLQAVASTFTELGNTCIGFADDVEHHRQMIEDELVSFIEWTVGIQIASGLFAVVTLGGSEAIGQGVQAAKIAAAAAKVREILLALKAATALRLAPVARTLGVATRASESLEPIVTASTRMARVRALGAAGEKAAGITKNTRRIPSLLRPGRYRIPDEFDDVARIIGEVKNVARQGLTSQLKDFLAVADSRPGWKFVLYVRAGEGTTLSGPLQALEDAGRIIVRRVL
jgi:hypothetical protein